MNICIYMTTGPTATNCTCVVRVFSHQLHFDSEPGESKQQLCVRAFFLYTRIRYEK